MKEQIVITGTTTEFEQYCMQEGRNRSNTYQVIQAFQLAFYPDAEIVLYGNYHSNPCYDTKALKEALEDKALKEFNEAR